MVKEHTGKKTVLKGVLLPLGIYVRSSTPTIFYFAHPSSCTFSQWRLWAAIAIGKEALQSTK